MFGSARFRRGVLIVYWIWIYMLTHWPGIDDLVEIPRWLSQGDKIVHFSMYFGWMVLWWWLLSAGRRQVGGAAFGWLIAGGAVYGMFDELTQIIVSRDFEMLDWAADVTGLTVAALILLRWQDRRRAPNL